VARPRVSMRKIRDVLRLSHGERLSRRQVSASLEIPLTTVNDHLVRARRAGLSWPLPGDMDDATLERALFPPTAPSSVARPMPDWGRVHKELKRKGVTLQLLWIEYRETHEEGLGYSQFCNLYRVWRKTTDVVMRQNHLAGEKMFVDFSGMRIPVYDRTTGRVAFQAELFVAALGASSYTYAEALRSQELLHWVTANTHALEFFGGAPAICVPDNLRSAVNKADRYEPDVNATFQEFANHYQMAIVPARPYKPRDKAKVEAAVLLAERWIIARLRNRRFYSLQELNLAIAQCLEVINARPFKKMDSSRRELFEAIDRPALRPLPADHYDFAFFKLAKVSIDYHVELRSDRHFYSVPYQLAGSEVELRVTASVVEVLFSGKRVASHLRSFVRQGYSTEPAHMPESHRRHAEWTPSRILVWAEKTGPSTAGLIAGILERRPHPEQGFRSALGIIRLGDRNGSERLEAACARALAMKSFSYKSVSSILAHNLDQEPLPERKVLGPHPHHRNVRGGAYYR
jgi:transposase